MQRVVSERPGDPKNEVVARLVLEQQRRSRLEEGAGILDAANVHAWIVGPARVQEALAKRSLCRRNALLATGSALVSQSRP